MSGTDSASGETPSAPARLSVSSALGVLLPDSYCAIRMSAVFSGKPTTCPKYFCVIPRRLRKKRILSPIAIAQHSFMYCATSIAYGFRLCQDSKSKKVKYFPASLLTIANSLSIMIKQIALIYLQTTEYPSCVTVMAYPLGQIGMRPESSPTLNKRTIAKRKG